MPTTAYDPVLSQLLVHVCELTYTQYEHGPPPGNDGRITPPAGYSQSASFTAPEIDFSRDLEAFKSINTRNLAADQLADLESLATGVGKVYFGFALTSAENNIIALRGTRSAYEWALDATVPQVPVPHGWFGNDKFHAAKAHLGFIVLFTFLIGQILEAAKNFDRSLPCYVTGHSLGAALAVLTAVPVHRLSGNHNVRMYNYAGPRVGDPNFVEGYTETVPNSYRVVNLADLVTILPPTKIFNWEYGHVGEEWSFLNQSGNVTGNHDLTAPDNYTAAVNQEVPANTARTYPTSCG